MFILYCIFCVTSKVRTVVNIVCQSLHQFLSYELQTMINSVQDLVDLRDFVDVHNVRIRPSKILFQNAYEGRSYKTKITIQNIGTVKVLVQIAPPSSYAFNIKSMKRPEALSPGLTINRTVSYTYSHAYVTVCQIPIHIDKELVDITINVEVLAASLSVTPDIIDFGTVDVGLTSSLRVLRLSNDGNIASSFYIDIPKGKPRLIVDPIRGQVLAKSFIDVSVKLVSCEAQCLKAELWIKCDSPLRIPVKGEVIVSKFESIHPTATESFTVIDFPPTYVGVTNSKYLLVRNYSSVANMFCIMGEIRQKSTPLDKCKDILYYHEYFRVYPTEGRFEPEETKLFQFVFKPKKRRGPDVIHYYVCAFLIHRVRCQDIKPEKYPEGIFTKPKPLKNRESIDSGSETGVAIFRNLSPLRQDSDIYFRPKSSLEPNFLRVFVHGVPEDPSVKVTPTDIVMSNLTIGVKETRVLELRNGSINLPIILQYRKVAFIELEKETIFLQPRAKIQLSVYITPFKCGPVSTKIVFNLLFYDCPKTNEDKYRIIGHLCIPVRFDTCSVTKYPKPELNPGLDPKYIKSVGIYCHGVQFNTPLKNTKCITVDSKMSGHRTGLVAFPNDTQQSLRPWRSNIECRTIFSNYPRYIPPLDTAYEVTVTDKRFKQDLDIFYSNFIRAEAERLRQMSIKEFDAVTEYTLTIGSKLLCTEPTKHKIDCSFKFAVSKSLHYISLSPAEMNNIIIVPTLIETGCIAANHPYNFKVWVTNSNEFAVHIFVRPDKPSLMFPQGDRFVVKEYSEIPIPVTYISNHIGYFILSLDIVTNDSMVITVAILANVVPSTLSLMENEVVFKDDITYSYFDLKNDLNVPISFEWVFEDENFTVSPRRGFVPENSCITCIIRYFPYVEGNLATDFVLKTDDTNFQNVKLVSTVVPSDVAILTPAMVFKNLSLNLPAIKKISIENRHAFPVGFQVLDCGLGDVILFAPTTGVIPPHCQTSIIIRIQMPHCVTFETRLRLRIVNADIMEIPITGNVVYPDISISPKVLQFKKIVATTTERLRFTVSNKSEVRATFMFQNEATDFRISEGEYHWSPTVRTEYELERKESKSFYIHFVPLEMTSMTFYLPIIINGIIGPPRLYDPLSTRCHYYLPECPPLCKPAPMPIQLPLIKIVGFAVEPKIRVTKLILEFLRLPESQQASKDSNKVIFTNNQNITENILFRIDHIMYPFRIDRIDAADVNYLEKAIVITLPPKAQAVVTFSFDPRDFCRAESFVPFYLKSESTMNPHAMLYLTGKYKEPTIMGERTIFYSRPYPLQYKAISSKVIKFQNHFKGCTVFTYTDLPELKIQLLYSTYTQISETEYEMECVFKTFFPNSIQFCNIIKFYCTCGSVWQSNIIGCAENCLLTNYAFAETFLPDNIESHVTRQKSSLIARASTMSMFDDVSRKIFIEEEYHTSTFFTSYPLFPLDDMFETQNCIDEKLSTFLLGVVEAVESWFFSQAMFGTVYYIIPLGINSVVIPHADDDVTKKKKVKYCEVPFINGLINLVGPQFKTILPPRPTLDTPIAEVSFIYEIYDCVIRFLKNLGAYFTYLQPEFLMPYTKFEIYKRCIYPTQKEKSPITMKIKTIAIFYYLSKQSWCDVLLQTYKVLYLFRLHEQTISKFSESALQLSPMKKYRSSVKNLARNCNIFSNSELFLINWLEYHYNSTKRELWGENCFLHKEVNFFGKDLRDGLVFAAVTATYCPYLTKYFKKMYTNPVGRDQLFHNNMIVIRCWDMLRYTYTVTPEDLINPNCIKMLMLVAYLYDVLPFMHPTEEINLEAKLSKKAFVKIKLHNINDFSIAYQPIIFDDTDGVLSTPSDQLVILPKATKTLTITYHAKFAKPVQAYILLNGECKGYHYAKCKCLTLIASPDITYASSTFNLSFPMYSFNQFKLTVQSPYKSQATYSMKLLTEDQLTHEELDLVGYITAYHSALPFNRVGVIDYEFRAEPTGVGYLEIAVCYGYSINFPRFVYFSNPVVGDFLIKLNTVPTSPKVNQELKVMVLKKVLSASMHNIRGVFVEVPCKNHALWNAMRQYLVELSFGYEKLFWQKNMKSTIGLHLMQKLWTQDTIIKGSPAGLYYHKKVFSVTIVNNKHISLPTEVVIEDDWSTGSVKLPINFLSTCKEFPESFSFKMTSTDGATVRKYLAEFVFVDNEEEFYNSLPNTPVFR